MTNTSEHERSVWIEMSSRRGFLRLAESFAVGVGILLISGTLSVISPELLKKSAEHLADSLGAQNDAANSKASLITVNVYYSMMAQYTDLSEENFVLQTPATVQDLIDTSVIRHPSMAQMVHSMLILLDGVPSKPGALLRNGDTIQFVPLSAGG